MPEQPVKLARSHEYAMPPGAEMAVAAMERVLGPRPTSSDRLAEYIALERVWNDGRRYGESAGRGR